MNGVRAVWAAGNAAILGWMHLPSALAAEGLSRCGYDGIVVDLQHGEADLAAVMPMLMAIELGGAEPFVRLQSNASADVMKALDLGAYGVIAPLVESAEDATAFANALHYPPGGCRSFGPRRPALRYGSEYLACASESAVAFAMVETATGLANLDSILEVDGYDGVFIGPSDLAFALGRTPRADTDDPEVTEAILHIRERCASAGKRSGLFCHEPTYARRMIDLGFDLVTLAPDLVLMTEAAKRALRVFTKCDPRLP